MNPFVHARSTRPDHVTRAHPSRPPGSARVLCAAVILATSGYLLVRAGLNLVELRSAGAWSLEAALVVAGVPIAAALLIARFGVFVAAVLALTFFGRRSSRPRSR